MTALRRFSARVRALVREEAQASARTEWRVTLELAAVGALVPMVMIILANIANTLEAVQ